MMALTLPRVTVVRGEALPNPTFDGVRASGIVGACPEAAAGSSEPWSMPQIDARRVSNSFSILMAA